MKQAKASSAEEYKLSSSFEAVRRTLLDNRYQDRLEKPLAFWALPNDRRLPLAFLGRTVGDLLDTPFNELSATPGIGQKKISSLVKLLHRATKEHPPTIPYGISELATHGNATANGETQPVTESSTPGDGLAPPESQFDSSMVSEALWEQWQGTIRRHNVAHEKLGRLAPTLRSLPTVIWHTPMGDYLDYTVAEIRQFKTHGEKRVRVVLEVFHVVHEMLSHVGAHPTIAVSLCPRFVVPITSWLTAVLEQPGCPTEQEVREHLTLPLLKQIELDVNDTVFRLAEGRLGIQGPPQSVRMQSRRMGVTRARIYQLLDDCSKVMGVRWPNGRCLLAELAEKFQTELPNADDRRLFDATRELFFPDKLVTPDDDTP